MEKNQVKKIFFFWILASFSFVLVAFVDRRTGLYTIQILAQILCAALFVLRYNSLDSIGRSLLIVFFFCFAQMFINPSFFRMSTCAYTFLFFVSFIVYRQLLREGVVTYEAFLYWLKIALILYSSVLFIQQIQSLTGMPVFNLRSNLISKFKLNSLTSEPSNLAIVVPAYFFTYIKMREIQYHRKYNITADIKSDLLVWFLFFYTSFSCGSMSAFFAAAVILMYFINKNNFKYVAITIASFMVILPLFAYFQIFNFDRLEAFLQALFAFNPISLINIDPSSACRIIPYYIYVQSIDPFDWRFWLGHGIDQAENASRFLILTTKYNMETVDLTRNIGAINITSFFYDYGFFAAVFFLTALKKSITKKWLSYEMFFYIAVFSIVAMNHRVLWLFLMLMTTVSYFKSKSGFYANK